MPFYLLAMIIICYILSRTGQDCTGMIRPKFHENTRASLFVNNHLTLEKLRSASPCAHGRCQSRTKPTPQTRKPFTIKLHYYVHVLSPYFNGVRLCAFSGGRPARGYEMQLHLQLYFYFNESNQQVKGNNYYLRLYYN